ncbi:MAG: hypothetical protein V7607_743 [Solirubrobacteraceae bacterium]
MASWALSLAALISATVLSLRPQFDVAHVSPVAFGDAGAVGGGERYPLELARAMAAHVPTKLVTFGPRAAWTRDGELMIQTLPVRGRWKGSDINPLSERLLPAIAGARVVHAHHYDTIVTNACLLAGRAMRRRVFASDHGGSARNYRRELRLDRLLTGLLAVSEFSASFFPELADRTGVIYGGVDVERYAPDPSVAREDKVVCVGRLLRHKAIDVVIRAVDPAVRLEIFGRPYDLAYRAELEQLAAGRNVRIHDAASDDEVLAAYRGARVCVLASRYDPPNAAAAPKAELLGLTLLEAMACGTPVVCTRVGAMPEIVVEGVTGHVVEAGDPAGLGARIAALLDDRPGWQRRSDACVAHVRSAFTWDLVARRCLRAYCE